MKDDFKEAEFISKRNEDKKGIYIVVVVLVVVLALICSAIWLIKSDKVSLISKNSGDNSKIELKHTEVTSVKSEGVYITDVSEVVDSVMPSIVAITSKTVIDSGNFGFSFFGSGKYIAQGAGSGVIVYEDNSYIYILTNYHVVQNATELSVKFIDDESSDAAVKGVSERKDVAIVSVKKSNISKTTLSKIKIATLGNSDELKVGNGIIAIGNALGYGQSVTTGVVSALNREIVDDSNSQRMIQIDAAINGGNSGGALLNSKGEVVGINTAKYSSSSYSSSSSIEGMGFAIPISDVETVIKELISGKNDENLLLGVEGYITTSSYRTYNLPEGLYVTVITKGGNAENSDLEIGDIITEIDGNKVTSLETIRKVLNKKEKGDTVKLKVKYVNKNTYKEKEVKITLK